LLAGEFIQRRLAASRTAAAVIPYASHPKGRDNRRWLGEAFMACGDTKMLDTIIGGVLAIAGGLLGTIYAARKVRSNRMEELIAERKVDANAEAYTRAKQIQAMWIQASQEQTEAALLNHEDWFFKTRLFLPGKFPDLWMQVRSDIQSYGFQLHQPSLKDSEMQDISERIKANLNKAILEIYADMKVPPMDLSGLGGGGGHTA
jgi:hypothetical protein